MAEEKRNPNRKEAEALPVSEERSAEARKAEAHDEEKKHKKNDKEIEELRLKLEEKEKEAKKNYESLLRTAADFENYKKRMAREKEEWTKFANEELIKAILPFIDNLERAINFM